MSCLYSNRSRNDNDDKGEVVVWELAEQEDEELNRIEESRKRTQAILEKYKKKSEQQNGSSSHDKGKGDSQFYLIITVQNSSYMMI